MWTRVHLNSGSLETMGRRELVDYLLTVFRRAILHYGFWFNETEHQLGLETALETEAKVADILFPVILKRLARTLGARVDEDGIPAFLEEMPRDKLLALIDAMSVNWLAGDGIWFQAVEEKEGIDTAKRCNDTCWTRFSPLEACTLKKLLGIPAKGGIEGLEQALDYRLYARINPQTIVRNGDSLTLTVVECRVQHARTTKGLEAYPCRSAGLVEYTTFARTIDPRIGTRCICCPPESTPEGQACSWEFTLKYI